MSSIAYPYLPEGRTIKYVPMTNQYMLKARTYAKDFSLDTMMPTASVIVKDGKIITMAANGSDYHEKHGCERVRLGSKTGEDYDKCEGCSPINHSERRAVFNALREGYLLEGADLYLWGHWWCCEPCWKSMNEAGISDVYLLEKSEILFNKEADGNIVGRQFD